MSTKHFLIGLLAVSLSTFAVIAETNAPAVSDYTWLGSKTLPQPGPMLDAAIANLPKTVREKGDWAARMKKAAWVPNLELRYGIGQGNFRQYRAADGSTGTTHESFGVNDQAEWLNDYGLALSWDLSRVIFRSEEINVLSAEMSKETFRENVRSQVITTYYELKESVLLLENENFKDSIPTKIKKERLAFLLDTLTTGELTNRGQPKK